MSWCIDFYAVFSSGGFIVVYNVADGAQGGVVGVVCCGTEGGGNAYDEVGLGGGFSFFHYNKGEVCRKVCGLRLVGKVERGGAFCLSAFHEDEVGSFGEGLVEHVAEHDDLSVSGQALLCALSECEQSVVGFLQGEAGCCYEGFKEPSAQDGRQQLVCEGCEREFIPHI